MEFFVGSNFGLSPKSALCSVRSPIFRNSFLYPRKSSMCFTGRFFLHSDVVSQMIDYNSNKRKQQVSITFPPKRHAPDSGRRHRHVDTESRPSCPCPRLPIVLPIPLSLHSDFYRSSCYCRLRTFFPPCLPPSPAPATQCWIYSPSHAHREIKLI